MKGPWDELLQIGTEEATAHCKRYLVEELLWVAVGRSSDAAVAAVFERAGVPRQEFRRRIRGLAAHSAGQLKPYTGKDVKIADEVFGHFKKARQHAETKGRSQPHPIDLLGVLCEQVPVTVEAILAELSSSGAKLREACTKQAELPIPEAVGGTAGPGLGQESILAQFSKDYSALAREKKIGPVIGRRKEILQVLQVLARKEKNNPVLVGEPGVGKTAIVEALALKTLEASAPPFLKDKRILEISMGQLVAGTKYRGEFEERMQKLVDEAMARDDVILFLDEIHTIMGAGGGSGAPLDAANILKPALARGRLRLLGATTPEEYRKHIETDGALERRFQIVRVEEPTANETVEILRGLREAYEQHHQADITEAAIQAAVDLTVRYVPERRLPDKARDVLDQAAAQARLKTLSFRPDQPRPQIGREDIAAVIAQWKGIPAEQLKTEDRQRLAGLADRLQERVKGQGAVVEAVAQAVQVAMLGLSNPNRPHGVFLFAGPTGVGKTELAKALAEQLFGSEAAPLRFDMSEYMEPHSVSRLVGSPPGYVGHQEGAQLIDKVRQHPFSVILLDEVEKAHPQVMNLFLQVFDDGRLTSSTGKTADFRNTIILMTSNLGAAEAADKGGGVFGLQQPLEQKTKLVACVAEAVKNFFTPEFLGRLTGLHVFNYLDRETAVRIVDRLLGKLQTQLSAHQVRLDIADGVRDFFLDKGFTMEFGGRQLERAIDQWLRNPIARLLLEQGGGTPRTLSVLREAERLSLVWDDPLNESM